MMKLPWSKEVLGLVGKDKLRTPFGHIKPGRGDIREAIDHFGATGPQADIKALTTAFERLRNAGIGGLTETSPLDRRAAAIVIYDYAQLLEAKDQMQFAIGDYL